MSPENRIPRLLPTKLKIPDLRKGSVERDQVLRILRGATDVNLILFHAPAGYGKTTAMGQLARRMVAEGQGVGWLTLDDRDADFPRFLTYFDAALSRALGHAGILEDKVSRAHATEDTETLIARYVTLLNDSEGEVALFLDDFENAATPEIESFLRRMVTYLPRGKKLVIGSRTISDMKLAKLKLSGQLMTVGTDDLRFRFSETREFFVPDFDLDEEDIRQLQCRTDGWAAAMQFVSLSFSKRQDHRSYVRSFSSLTPELTDYLATDVFLHQTPEIRDFLLKSSILSLLSPALCVAVTGRDNSRDLLEFVERAGLFLEYVELSPPWFKYHSLFREFLEREFQRQLPEEKLRCHKTAAIWYEENDKFEEAIPHYAAAGNDEKVADLIEQNIQRLVFEERLGMVIKWVEMLPRDILDERDVIRQTAIIAYAFRRDFAKAREILQGLGDRLGEAPLALRSQHKSLELFLLAAEDRMEEMGAAAEQFLNSIPEEMAFEYGIHLNAYAYWLCATNRFAEAHAALIKAQVAHDSVGDLFGRVYQEGIDGTVAYAQGALQVAIERLRQGLKHAERNLPPGSSAGAYIAAHFGEALYEINDGARAQKLLEDYLPLIEANCIADAVVVAYVTLARIKLRDGDGAGAAALLEALRSLGETYGLTRIISDARFELLRLATLTGDMPQADMLVRELGLSGAAVVSPVPVINHHSSDIEPKGAGHARYLIRAGRLSDARALLRQAMTQAEKTGRSRRLITLRTLNAVAIKKAGEAAAARREMQQAVKLALPGRFIRCFVDEGPDVISLLGQIYEDITTDAANVEADEMAAYLRELLKAAGRQVQAVAEEDSALTEPLENLTDKEKEILGLLAIGKANKAMACHLGVSDNTIKWHLRNIYEKLGVNNRTQAVTRARKFGLLT